MSLAWSKTKLYTKSALVLIVAVAVGAILIKNRNHTVQVWFFGIVDPQREINVVWLMLWTAVGAILTWWVLRTTVSLIKDTRRLRQEEELRRRRREQERRETELAEREQRLDKADRQSSEDAGEV